MQLQYPPGDTDSKYIIVHTHAFKLKLMDCCFNKDTKLKRRRRRKIIKVVGGHLIRAAKALVVSKPMAIFHTGHGKS